jgi:hypothetical protein
MIDIYMFEVNIYVYVYDGISDSVENDRNESLVVAGSSLAGKCIYRIDEDDQKYGRKKKWTMCKEPSS